MSPYLKRIGPGRMIDLALSIGFAADFFRKSSRGVHSALGLRIVER
jgi:hypothetical protein